MRILTFNYEYPPLGGGGGVVHKQIVDALAERHRVTVVTSGYGDLPSYDDSNGVEIYRVPVVLRTSLSTATLPSMLSYVPRSWSRGRRLLQHGTYDVINSHFAVPSSLSAQRLAQRFGVPHVLSVHGGDLYDPSKKLSPHRMPVLRGVVRNALRRADCVVAQSTNTADNARSYYGVRRPIDIIPLGIVRPTFHAATRAEMDIEDDRFVIVTLGRLVARKGLSDLLHAVAKLGDDRDLLLVLGDGPKKAEWEQLASELGIRDRVRFAGHVSEEAKWRYLSVSDLFASTSLHEGFGLVYLEAMHCGLPVVTYDCGGQTDFLEDGKTGAMVSLGRQDIFTNALRTLKDSGEARRTCGEFNREKVAEYYIDSCARRYEQLFEEVIRSGAHQAGRAADQPQAGSKEWSGESLCK